MRGIDISNHQKDLDISSVLPNVGFVMCKATEGLSFVDAYCDVFVQKCISAGKPWGFYHFAGDGNPEYEASYFVEHTYNYFGKGLPMLDWEGDQSVEWVNRFVRKVHDMTQVWPVIYGNPWRFNQGGVEPNCGRWVASYPNWYRPSLSIELPEPPETDGLVCAWQFASDGVVPGAEGWELDVDEFYGDEAAWEAYAVGERGGASNPVGDSVSVLENGEYRITVERK
jgi:GH25 family lysozyme M1 (1,4-beta-N-acetylmuramidase)